MKSKLASIVLIAVLLTVMVTASAGCSSKPANPELIMASTTSTGDSGLMDTLIPLFQKKTGYNVKPIYVGSGAAMTMGERGEADVLLVHAPESEVKFMQAGHGVTRKIVMHNDFIIVGSPDDPAGIKGSPTAVEAFQKIAEAQAPFISRGDDSGTHKMELAIWKKAGVTPEGDWYQESGQGMGATLKIASEKNAYTLTDRATYLANKDTLALDILVEGDKGLLNVYHVIVVNPDKHPKVNIEGARAFAAFLTSKAGQAMIGEFGKEKFGQPLFFPDADKTDADLGLE